MIFNGVLFMLKKIDVTQVGLSIARLIRLSLKNFRLFIYYTVLGSLLAFFYTTSPLMDRGTYIASASVAHNSNGSATTLNTIIGAITSTEFSESVALQLEEDEIGLINDTFLTSETIKSGLTAVTIPNSLRINVTFSYPDETLSVTILNEIIDQSITFANDNFPALGNGVVLGEYAIDSIFDGTPSTTYLAFGAFIGLIIGGLVGVILHALKGTIYSSQDIIEFEISSFFLQMKIKTQLTLDRFLNLVGFGNRINFESDQ
jgi:hypothetical protein